MLWQWSPYVIAEVAAAACIIVMAIYFPWRDLNRRASLIGVTLLLVCSQWMLAHAIEIGLPVPSIKSYLMRAQLIWGIIALTLWLLYLIWIPAFAGMTGKKRRTGEKAPCPCHPRGPSCHPRGPSCHPRGPSCHPRGPSCHPRGGGDPDYWQKGLDSRSPRRPEPRALPGGQLPPYSPVDKNHGRVASRRLVP